MGNSLTRKQIEEIYNSAPAPGQTNSNSTPSFNLSRDEITNIYNSYTPEIPKLDQNTTPTPTSDYRAEIERMNKLKADTTAPRTEGENQAIDTYLNSLTDAQRYFDSQKSVSTTTTSGTKVKKQPIGTVEIKADGTKKFTKAMSAEEKKNFEDKIQRQNLLEQAKVIGKQAKENAQPRERALSANEQRDLERAQEAISNAQKNEVVKEEKNVSIPTTDQEKIENIQVGQIQKTPETETLSDKFKKAKAQFHANDKPVENIDRENNINYALATPGNPEQLSDFKRLQNTLLYDAYTHEVTPESETFKKYNIPATEWNELGEDLKDWNVYRGNVNDPISAVVSSNIADNLKEKYDLDFHTLTQMANDYQNISSTMKGEQYAEQAREFGVEHPAAASLASLGVNVGSAILAPTQIKEDMTNYVGSGMPVSPYEGAHLLSQEKTNLREGVKDNFDTGAGQLAYDIGMGFGDFGTASIPSLVGAPVSAPAIMALQTLNDTSTSALERGSNPVQASLYAIGSAGADYILNKVGLENAKSMALDRLKGAGFLKFLARNGAAGGVEAGENLLQEGIQTALDEIINGEHSEMRTNYAQRIANGEEPINAIANVALDKLKQYGVSAGTGWLMGSATQGFESLTNEAVARLIQDDLDKNSQKVWERVDEYKNQLNPLEEAQENIIPETPLVQQTKKPVPGAWIPVEPEIPAVENIQKQIVSLNPDLNNEADANLFKTVENNSGIDVKSVKATSKALDDNINSLANMFGKQKNNEGVVALKEALNEYAETGSEEALTRARTIAANMDDYYSGATYKSRKGNITEFGNGTKGTFTSQVNDFADKLKAKASISGQKVNAPEIDERLNNLFARYDLSSEDAASVGNLKQAINNLLTDPSDANWENLINAASDISKRAENLSEYVSSYKGKTKTNPFDMSELVKIVDSVDKLSKNSKTVPTTPAPEPELQPVTPPTSEPDITTGRIKERRTITNTMRNAGIISDADLNDPEIQRIKAYEEHSNEKTYDAARKDIINNRGAWERDYTSGKKEINTDSDLDRSMILLKELKREEQAGDNATSVKVKKNAIMRNAATNGTIAGQFIQAMAKYANTAEEALIKATKLDMDETNRWASRNKSAVKTNAKLAKALQMQGYDGTMDVQAEKPTIDVYRNRVRYTLNKEFGSISRQFSDSDIDYLANLIEQGATTKELTEALNTKMATGKWGISDETQKAVNDIFDSIRQYDENSREFVEGQAEAFRLLAEEVAPKATAMEKFDAWRYMAMLGNPKTMLRNYVGNKMFGAVVGASNTLSAALESKIDKAYFKKTGQHMQRQKAVLNPFSETDNNLIDLAYEDGFGKRFRQFLGSKYEKPTKDAILEQRSVFDTKALQLAEKAVDAGISDTKAVAKKYSTSLAGYLKANGLDASAFKFAKEYDDLKRASRTRELTPAEQARMETLKPLSDFMETARDYALKQAEYATFHEPNVVAEMLSSHMRDWRNGYITYNNKQTGKKEYIYSPVAKALGYSAEGILPFKKTPANILRSGFEYSPFGAIKSIKETGKLIYENTGNRKNNLDETYTTKSGKNVSRSLGSDVIDSWSKTLTGSLLTTLGYFLFNNGVLTSSSKGEKYQDQLEGKGNYAININGHTYTIDWAAPGSMPLLLGAEICKLIHDKGMSDDEYYSNADKWISTVNSLLDPILETSMLSGLKDTLDAAARDVRYNEDNAAGGIMGSLLANSLTGYLSQGIPTLTGQFARTIDPYRRATDTTAEGVLEPFERQLRKTANKIPLLSMINPEYINARGEMEYNSPFVMDKDEGVGLTAVKALGNLGYQMFSPGYYSHVDTTDADRVARDIFNAEDDEGVPYLRDPKVFQTWKSTKKINGEKLNPEQMQEYRIEMGQAGTELRDMLANNEDFLNLSPSVQNDIYKKVNTFADKVGEGALNPDMETNDAWYKAYTDNDYDMNAVVEQILAENNPYGLSKDSYNERKENGEDLTEFEGYGETLDDLGIEDKKVYQEAWLSGGEEAVADEAEFQQALKDTGLSDSQTTRAAWDSKGKQGLGRIAEYNQAFKDAGMSEVYTSKSAKQAYNDSLKDPRVMDKYARYRQYLKANDMKDSEENWNQYQKSGSIAVSSKKSTKEPEPEQNVDWKSYGLDKLYDADSAYAKAHDVIPTLTEQQFANQWKEMDADGNGKLKKKDEVIPFLNSIGADQEKMEQIWKAYTPVNADGSYSWNMPTQKKDGTWR